ncbi:hypothetical protein V8B97DRAFT_376241 [Scleroderma yunnanense]
MSVLRALWQRLFRRSYLVGKDFEGNQYFEFPSGVTSSGRPKRIIRYSGNDDILAYVASGGKRLSVQWSAWLAHTRRDPPTLEELRADLLRQKRVQVNVALLEAREREERTRTFALDKPPPSQITTGPDLGEAPFLVRSNQPISDSKMHDPWSEADARKGQQEPQAWGPVVRRR